MGGRCNFADATILALLRPCGVKRRVLRCPGEGQSQNTGSPGFWKGGGNMVHPVPPKPKEMSCAVVLPMWRHAWSFGRGTT